MYCIICLNKMEQEENWYRFFTRKASVICSLCDRKLPSFTEKRCFVCSRNSLEEKCFDCKRWEAIFKGKDVLTQNISLFPYDTYVQDLVYTWKYRGDYYMAEAFRERLQRVYKQMLQHPLLQNEKNLTVTYIPLSDERMKERGFNQAAQLAEMLPGEIVPLFKRINNEKQAKKSRSARMKGKNPFSLIEDVKTSIILVDDIYTTGRTLRHAASLCKLNGCEKVFSITLCRG